MGLAVGVDENGLGVEKGLSPGEAAGGSREAGVSDWGWQDVEKMDKSRNERMIRFIQSLICCPSPFGEGQQIIYPTGYGIILISQLSAKNGTYLPSLTS